MGAEEPADPDAFPQRAGGAVRPDVGCRRGIAQHGDEAAGLGGGLPHQAGRAFHRAAGADLQIVCAQPARGGLNGAVALEPVQQHASHDAGGVSAAVAGGVQHGNPRRGRSKPAVGDALTAGLVGHQRGDGRGKMTAKKLINAGTMRRCDSGGAVGGRTHQRRGDHRVFGGELADVQHGDLTAGQRFPRHPEPVLQLSSSAAAEKLAAVNGVLCTFRIQSEHPYPSCMIAPLIRRSASMTFCRGSVTRSPAAFAARRPCARV